MGLTAGITLTSFRRQRTLLHGIMVFGFKLTERSGAEHSGLLNCVVRLEGDRTQSEGARGHTRAT